jgi:hypothetical protein
MQAREGTDGGSVGMKGNIGRYPKARDTKSKRIEVSHKGLGKDTTRAN